MSKVRKPKRILIDTNIWRYLLDFDLTSEFINIANNDSYEIQIAPAVLYETLRLKDNKIMRRLIKLITNKNFTRLMPEAYSESMDLLAEVGRIRPQWLKTNPDIESFNKVYRFWTKKYSGKWHKITNNPVKESKFLRYIEGDKLKLGKEALILQREDFKRLAKEGSLTSHNSASMDKWFLTPDERSFFKQNEDVQVGLWRSTSERIWAGRLSNNMTSTLGENTFLQWLSPFLDVSKIPNYPNYFTNDDWISFWYSEVKREALPREWVRWSFGFAQAFRKPTGGSLGDQQLSSHFTETDVIVTADKAMLQKLEEIRPFTKFDLPIPFHVSANMKGLKHFIEYIQNDDLIL